MWLKWTRGAVATTALVGLGLAPLGAQAPTSGAVLFATYRATDPATAMATVSALSESGVDDLVRDLRRRVGVLLREAGGTPRARVVLATFLLDVATTRLETDWREVRDLVEVGCRLVDSLDADADVLRWHLAALAAAQGAADVEFLAETVRRAHGVKVYGHLSHSRAKFPREPRFRLAEATVSGMGLADLAPPRDQPWMTDADLSKIPGLGTSEVDLRRERRRSLESMRRLTTVGGIEAEAHLRAGHVALELRDDPAARAHLGAALDFADEPFVTYNARLLLAMLHDRLGASADLERELRQSLALVPFAQSAMQMLSTRLFLAGREAEAYDLLDDWSARRTRPRDPWRLFGYGDFRRFPALITELREHVRRP